MDDCTAYLGVDWSDRKHDLCLIDPTTGKKDILERFSVDRKKDLA
jgi:hypothetical protein